MPVPKQVGEVKALKKEDSVGGASLGISSSIFHWLLLNVQILNAARKVRLQGLVHNCIVDEEKGVIGQNNGFHTESVSVMFKHRVWTTDDWRF